MVKPLTRDNYVEKYANDYVKKFKDIDDVFVSPWGINMAGNKISGLFFASKSDEAASREYADKVGNDARPIYRIIRKTFLQPSFRIFKR